MEDEAVRRLALGMAVLVVSMFALQASAADEKDSPKATKTREMLKKKVTLNFKNEFLKDILEEVQDQVKGIKFKVDTKGGVSQNKRMTIMCKDVTLEEALDKMLGKEDLGYYVIVGGAYDGLVFIKMGKERGFKKD
jgi:type II secretory pathway component GspD/PulD (secretin)